MNVKKVTHTGGELPKAPSADSYADLVRAAAGGDRQAMERLLVHVQETAWRFSMSVCGRADDAEDAMQEALLKTYLYTSQIREADAFRPWLHRTVRNACLMSRRKRAHEPAHLESLDEQRSGTNGPRRLDPPDPGRNPEELAANVRLGQRLRQALRRLPPSHRAVVFLRETEGLSTREVAQVLGISEDNVKTRLARARKALQTALAGSVE